MALTRAVGVVLALALGLIPIAPAEHAHETEDHGQPHLLVHRHLAAHTAHHDDADHDGVFDDDDGRIVTLDSVYTAPIGRHAVSAGAPTEFVRLAAQTLDRSDLKPRYFARPIHGPPRTPNGLRAPPSISRL